MTDENLDRLIWGAKAIAGEANLWKRNDKTGEMEPDDRKAFHLIETGVIRAKHVKGRDKAGKEKARGHLVSTPRLIRNSLLPEAST